MSFESISLDGGHFRVYRYFNMFAVKRLREMPIHYYVLIINN